MAWALYLFIGTAPRFFTPGDNINVLDIFFTELPNICVFYLNYVILDKFLANRRYVLLLVSELLLFSFCALLFVFTGYVVGPVINEHEAVPPFVLSKHLADTFWTYMVYTFFSCGYYFARQAVNKEKQLKKVELDRMQAEQEKLEAEYAFLRAQINPHFLHNTLNFFYAKSLNCSKELSDGILTLCEIMRYSLNSGEDEAGTVLLSKEVEHLQNVIKINQLRFSNRLQVNFDVSGDIGAIRIIPLVLITLVENAFKHGELTNRDHPLTLKLLVGNNNQHVYFSIRNKKKTGPKELSHGIGMENIRRRLYASYKDRCTLTVADEDDWYAVELAIRYPEPQFAPASNAVGPQGANNTRNTNPPDYDQLFNSR